MAVCCTKREEVHTPSTWSYPIAIIGAGVLHVKIGELDISQDLKFQKRSWKVERGGWIIGALVLAAALMGLLGPGPLSKAKAASTGNALVVEYNKFERYQAPVHLRIQIDGPNSTNGAIRLWVDQSYVEALEIRHIDPQPESVEISGERLMYVFKGSNLPAQAKVSFHFEPNTFGKMPVRIGLVNGPEVQFTQFFLP